MDPDIVLLDIEMPEADGLEAVRNLPRERQPTFIFVAAYERYAAEAFEVEALDYLLKPVSEALERAERRIREREASAVAGKVATLTASLASGEPDVERGRQDAYLERLPITADGRTRFIEARHIVWIESQDYYVELHTRGRSPVEGVERAMSPSRPGEARCPVNRDSRRYARRSMISSRLEDATRRLECLERW